MINKELEKYIIENNKLKKEINLLYIIIFIILLFLIFSYILYFI